MRLRNIPGSREVIAESRFVIQNPEAYKGRWTEVFGNERPLYVEIGMGKGRFLMDSAAAHPENNYIGIEMMSSVLVRAVQKAEERFGAFGQAVNNSDKTAARQDIPAAEADLSAGPAAGADSDVSPDETDHGAGADPVAGDTDCDDCNFRFLRMDARFLTDVFDTGEVDRIYLNFSDPWPKSRHGGRRLTSGGFLERYEKILKSGGWLEFKTDNTDLFAFSLEELERCGWELTVMTRDLHADAALCVGNIMTEYEEKFSAAGHPICCLKAHPGAVNRSSTC